MVIIVTTTIIAIKMNNILATNNQQTRTNMRQNQYYPRPVLESALIKDSQMDFYDASLLTKIPKKENSNDNRKNGKEEIPSFQILDANGNPSKSLVHCFLERTVISVTNLPPSIKAKNGKTYKAVYDNVSWKEGEELIKVFISFQQHFHGNFAIIRNLTERGGK
jgi:hypothetical protein